MATARLVVLSQADFDAGLLAADTYGLLLICKDIENAHGTFPNVVSVWLWCMHAPPVGLVLPKVQEVRFGNCRNVTEEWYMFPAKKYQYSGCIGHGPMMVPRTCEHLSVTGMGEGVHIDLRGNNGARLGALSCLASSVLVDETTRLSSLRDLELRGGSPDVVRMMTRGIERLVSLNVDIHDLHPVGLVPADAVRALRGPLMEVLARNGATLRILAVPPGTFTTSDIKTLVDMPALEVFDTIALPIPYGIPVMEHYLWLVRLAIAVVREHSRLGIMVLHAVLLDAAAFKTAVRMLAVTYEPDDLHRVFNGTVSLQILQDGVAEAVENETRIREVGRAKGVELPIEVIRNMANYVNRVGPPPGPAFLQPPP